LAGGAAGVVHGCEEESAADWLGQAARQGHHHLSGGAGTTPARRGRVGWRVPSAHAHEKRSR
jgi:hypothetical protein